MENYLCSIPYTQTVCSKIMLDRLKNALWIAVLATVACSRNNGPGFSDEAPFRLHISNNYNLQQAEYAAFLTDQSGVVRAFRWLPPNDSTQLTVPDAAPGERFDATLLEMKISVQPGSGIRDTTVALTTYTNLFNGAAMQLRDLNYLLITDLSIQLNGVFSLDSIVVSDGLPFSVPQAVNNFLGVYRVWHTGRIWCRLKVNSEPFWRYCFFENIKDATYQVAVDVTTLPQLPSPTAINFPLFTDWQVQIDRMFDLTARQFLPLGPPLPVPGNAVPVFDQFPVYEPANLPQAGYRLRAIGPETGTNGYRYACDLFYDQLPTQLPALGFDVQLAGPVRNRQAELDCTGFIQLLALRWKSASGANLSWEVQLAPSNTGRLEYQLPEVPAALANQFPVLKNYAFAPQLEVRAESYQKLSAYPEVIVRRLEQADPLWKMKAGYLARTRIFE